MGGYNVMKNTGCNCKKETVNRLWTKEWLQKRDELKLSSPNDFLNFLQIDEGTYKKLLNWLGPKIKKQYT